MTVTDAHLSIALPARGNHVLVEPGEWTKPSSPITSRKVYAAAHVIPRATADNTPGAPADIDWEATLAYRHELWSYGLGVADAMDTAQRGMGLDWAATAELIRRSGAEAATVGGMLACGAGTDQLDIDTHREPPVSPQSWTPTANKSQWSVSRAPRSSSWRLERWLVWHGRPTTMWPCTPLCWPRWIDR